MSTYNSQNSRREQTGSYHQNRDQFYGHNRAQRDNYDNQRQNQETQPLQSSSTTSRWDSLMTFERQTTNRFDYKNESRPSIQRQGFQRSQSYSSRSLRPNNVGFYGNLNRDERTERLLFNEEGTQSTGINFDKYDSIPVEVDGSNVPPPLDEFSIDIIGEQLMQNLRLCNFTKPTPVQKYAIPIGQNRRDLMACAQTGSGKTAGFLFPLIINLLHFGPPPTRAEHTTGSVATPVALVLAPTRELVSQIYDEAQRFCFATGIRPVAIYGGVRVADQLYQFQRGCDLLVATPGRLVDLIERGSISLEFIKYLVMDEADRMLDMGFEPQIRRIVEEEGMPIDRQTFMFSATFPRPIQRLASDFMKDYVFLTVGTVGSASQDVIQRVVWVEERDKQEYLMDLLGTIEEGLILVFVATKRGADDLCMSLSRESFPVVSIHGDKEQRERERALNAFKNGDTPILIATDVAARGLDIPNVSYVINFDLPSNIDDYVHRIGRTGRVGNVGTSVSFVSNETNKTILNELVDHLTNNNQTCPEWLYEMASHKNYGRRKTGTSTGGNKGQFGAYDARKKRGQQQNRSGYYPSSNNNRGSNDNDDQW